MGWNDLAPWQQGLVVCGVMLWIGRLVGQLAVPLVRIMEALERAHPVPLTPERARAAEMTAYAEANCRAENDIARWNLERVAREARQNAQEGR